MFTHNPIERRTLTRIDSPEGRRYLTPSGKAYESVTTWLGRVQDNSWLDEWRTSVGEAEADKISKRASLRGTKLHENAEKFLLNENVNIGKMGLHERNLFVPFSKILSKHVDNIRATEISLYSDTMRLAGTMDLFADFDCIPSIIDFKSSKNKKKKENIEGYFLQCSLYSYMIQEMYGIKVERLVVLIGVDYQTTTQVFIEERKNFDQMLFRLLKANPPI